MEHRLRLSFLLLFTLFFRLVQAQEPDTAAWVTNGRVNALAQGDKTLYIGGQFSYVGPYTGTGALLDAATGKLTGRLLTSDGHVYKSIADGKGGYYVGGTFKKVQGVNRAGLAHMLPDGSLDKNWDPKVALNTNGGVYGLTLVNNTLYVGGGFYAIGGQNRNYLAALDATTALATSWSPAVNNEVTLVHFTPEQIYLAGSFTTVGGQSRNKLAAVDPVAGQPTGWDPSPASYDNVVSISSVLVLGNTVYVGGGFTSIGGQYRSHLAALDATTGLATGWNPNLNTTGASVRGMAISRNVLYVGGTFNAVGGYKRGSLAAFDLSTGLVNGWNPSVLHNVYDLAVAGNTVYVAGIFDSVNGQSRKNVAALDAYTGQLINWDASAESAVNTITLSGSTVFVGGFFYLAGGQARNNLAAIDVTTGRATAWNPDVTGGFTAHVNALTVHNNRLYVGGNFSRVGGVGRSDLAAVDMTTGQPTAWVANVDNGGASKVNALAITGGTVYVGGEFYAVNSQSRRSLAAVDVVTGSLKSWNPNANLSVQTVYALGAGNNTVYAGGEFTGIGGQNRLNLAAIDATSGQVTPWNANISNAYGPVQAVVFADSVVYAGGSFGQIGGQSRNHAAALSTVTALATPWNANLPGGYSAAITAMALDGNSVCLGGSFSSVGGIAQSHVAVVDRTTGKLRPWQYDAANWLKPGNAVYAVIVANGDVYAGGSFFWTRPSRSIMNLATFRKLSTGPNFIKGHVYEDVNGDCVKNPGEKGMPGRVLVAQPGNYYGTTDSLGNYTLAVDTGSYAVSQVLPVRSTQLIRQVCPAGDAGYAVRFGGRGDTLAGKDFGNQAATRSYLTVNVAMTRRRRCAPGITTVSYTNLGSAAAEGVQVRVKMPEHVFFAGANAAYTIDADHNYVFSLGSLAAHASGVILIRDSIVCTDPAIRGLTQCTKAWITPANALVPPAGWDGSDVTLKAACLRPGDVRLGLYNSGTARMADSSAFRVYLDAQLAFAGNYQLNPGDSLILRVPANGQTVRLEADQRPGHPRKRQTNVTFEACGTNRDGTVSKGFVTQFPPDDAEPEVDVACMTIVDSFDPNDKTVFPRGVTDQRYTPTGAELEYVIRFQNTGTDVAHQVVIVDTLSEHLDLRTLQVGAVSHPYRLTVTGKGKPVLTWTFSRINLPDSATDQAGSNGHIHFSIRPGENLPVKTKIENYADIFFDYNEPVRTNTTLNTVYDVPAVAIKPGQNIVCATIHLTSNAGPDRTVCEQDTVVMQAVPPSLGAGRWRRLSGSGTIQSAGTSTTRITGLAYGDNVFEWSIPANTCGTDSVRARVTIGRLHPPAPPAITQVGTDRLHCSVEASNYEWYFEDKPLQSRAQTIQVSQAGSYAVRVSNSAGCFSGYSARFGYQFPCYDANPVVHAGVSRTVCEQDTVWLQAAAPLTGQGTWQRIQGAGVVQDPHHPAAVLGGLAYGENVYEWSVPANTCGTDSLRSRVIITRAPKPATPGIAVLGSDSLVCTLPASSYQWYLDGVALESKTRAIRAHRVGSYVVSIASGAGCSSDASPAFAFVLTAAEPAFHALVRVYPNPTSGQFVIVLPAGMGRPVGIDIYDALGKRVLSRTVPNPSGEHSEAFNLSSERGGIYLLKLQTRTGVILRKVVIGTDR